MKRTSPKWLYAVAYLLLVVIAFLPLYTELPYDSRNTANVIFEILSLALRPYLGWGWVFRLLTAAVIVLALVNPSAGGRAIAAYFGANYLVIAAIQTSAVTPTYGLAVHTGALVVGVLLGLLWLRVAWQGSLRLALKSVPGWRWWLLPFALLAFGTPMALHDGRVVPHWDPLALLTLPDYGLSLCFMTPVFLFLLILAWPAVDEFAFKLTAFNGLIYALFNMNHWAVPERVWLGVMHLPLLVLSLAALLLSRSTARERARQTAPSTSEQGS